MSESLVLTRLEDGVGIISLNRPDKHNAVNDEMSPYMRAAWDWALETHEVRAIVIRGEGPSFCSGRDTAQLGVRKGDDSHFSYVRRAQNGRMAIADAPKPIVAAVKGYALGGGFETALAADIRVGSPDSTLSLPEIRYGILPDTGGTQILVTLIGAPKTKYMVMTGARIDGRTAFEWGIFDWLVEAEEVDAKALEIAKQLAESPPIALAIAKQLVDQLWAGQIRNGIRQELLAQTALYGTEDYQEARAALRERRKPHYKGK